MQVESAASEMSAKPQSVVFHDSMTVSTVTTRTATFDHISERKTTGTVTRPGKFTKVACLLTSPPMSTIIDKTTTVRVTNSSESAYSIKKNTQIVKFSVVTREQSKFINPVDTGSSP